MALVWIVCGAHRGVGKTRVAQALARVLPGAVAAKLGCGRPKLDKPGHYFRDPGELRVFVDEHRDSPHLVLEANPSDLQGLGDIVVFIEGKPGHPSRRPDAAKPASAVLIRISSGASGGAGKTSSSPSDRGTAGSLAWSRALRPLLPDVKVRRAVCEIFVDQELHLRSPRIEVRTKTWFIHGGRRVFGLGLYRLLQQVDLSRSLREAARRCSVSYRYAWGLIKAVEREWRQPLLRSGPGGSTLTEACRRLLSVFEKVDRDVGRYANRRFEIHSRTEGLQ